MANLRPFLYMTLAVLAFFTWSQWQQDYARPPASAPDTAVSSPAADAPIQDPGEIPDAASAASSSADVPSAPVAADSGDRNQASIRAEDPRVTVVTDVLTVEISLIGGSVVNAWLRDYATDLEQPDAKVQLLNATGPGYFVAQSGLVASQGDAPNHTSAYQAERQEYHLDESADELRIPLRWQQGGIEVTKTFIFKRGRYDIETRHYVANHSAQAWAGSRYEQLQRVQPPDGNGGGFTNPERYSYLGGAVYTPEDKLKKIDFEDFGDGYSAQTAGGWLAMVQHYFFAGWIPQAEENNAYTSTILNGGQPRYLLRALSPTVSVAPGAQQQFTSRLYVGPKLQEQLDEIAPGLGLTVDYGIFTIFSKPLFWLLSKIHNVVGNWGWAIVILTILIKLAFFKLTEAQYRSMARMRKLQPRIEALKERYGDDRQKMSQAMMEIYRTEKVNPLGGCLPILVQIPIFIALYWVLLESVELRHAPFIGWIQNLTARDPYFVLPVLNGAFMILTQRLTPSPGMDPLQRKMMNALPVVFSVMFAFFPAGLVLYWATNAGLSLLQQWYITRKING